ncbi:hypothetical protein ABKN59_001539 [Abortiporus biennis]
MQFTLKTLIAILSAAVIVSAGPIPLTRRAEASPDVQIANGQASQAANAANAALTPDSPCTDGQEACVTGQFAQCVGGKFVLTPCAGGLTCVNLPLVGKPGTSNTCSTETDRDTRIQTALNGGSAPTKRSYIPAVVPRDPHLDVRDGGAITPEVQIANGQASQAANAASASLTPDSPCTDGENACINQQFAQCSGGKFLLTPCSGGLICVNLPLVGKAGTSNTCDTEADRDQRIATALNGGTPPSKRSFRVPPKAVPRDVSLPAITVVGRSKFKRSRLAKDQA